MRSYSMILVLILSAGAAMLPSRAADALDLVGVGARGGFDAGEDEDFEQYEGYATFALPWRWDWPSGWGLYTTLSPSIGALDGPGKTAAIASLDPQLVLSLPEGWVEVAGGIAPTLITKHRFRGTNLGGAVQFISHIGMRIRVGDSFSIGYRFQHMSNASIYNSNPGLNMHMFQLSYSLGN